MRVLSAPDTHHYSPNTRGICHVARSVGPVSHIGTPRHPSLWVFREGQGFILVYSIASRSTFDRLEVFRQSMRRVKRGEPIFMLVGNKCDKTYEREVSKEEGAAMARHFGCEFIETSAKTAQNVERLFMNLVRALRQTRLEAGGSVPTKTKEKKPGKCIIM